MKNAFKREDTAVKNRRASRWRVGQILNNVILKKPNRYASVQKISYY